MSKQKISMYLGIMFACILFFEGQAKAAASDDPANANPYQLEGIVVTAQKKEENVQDIPSTVEVFPETELESAGIHNTVELRKFIPNYVLRDGTTNYIPYMRGVGGFDTSLFSGTAMYIDDINVPLVFQADQELFDVERVEVLKGPQGTLYGGNSEAGIINIVTRQPDNTPRGKIVLDGSLWDTSHGTSPTYSIGASASGPLVEDRFYFSLSGKWDYNMGAIQNDYTGNNASNEARNIAGRMQLRFTPTEELDISFLADINNEHRNMGTGRYLENHAAAAFPLKTLTQFNTTFMDTDENTRHAYGNSQSLRIKYSGDEIDFLSITGRRYFGEDTSWDADATIPAFMGGADLDMMQGTELSMWSQEFRLSSSPKSKSPFSWIVGTYAYTQHFNGNYSIFMDMPAFSMTLNDDSRDTTFDMTGIAIFGQATYTILDKLHLTAGLRYDYLSQWGEQKRHHSGTIPTPLPPFPAFDNKYSYDKRLVSSEWLPKFSVAYDITDDAMVYATVSKGYLAGGFDYISGNQDSFTYDPEYTWNYELGVKTSWLDNKLLVNLVAFYIDISNKQVSEVTAASTAKISNAAKAESMGIELEIQAMPLDGLTLYGNLGIMQTRIIDWYDSNSYNNVTNTYGAYDYAGNELPFSPNISYSVGAMYQHESGIYGRVDVLGNGGYYYNAKNTNNEKEPAYATVNARLGYVYENFDISVYANNIFNKEYYTSRTNLYGYGLLAFEGNPREIGMTISYTF